MVDVSFAKGWPFGVLKTIQWVSALATLITIYLGPFIYSSVGFVLFISWIFFLQTFISWICYVIGLQHQFFSFGRDFIFLPLAMIDFISGIIGTLGFSFSALICFISMLDYRTGYRPALVITYLFATIFCSIATAAYGYYNILLYRACPNGQLRNLMTMVIDGTKISTLGNTPPPNDIPQMNVGKMGTSGV